MNWTKINCFFPVQFEIARFIFRKTLTVNFDANSNNGIEIKVNARGKTKNKWKKTEIAPLNMGQMKWNVNVEMEQKLEKVRLFSQKMCAVIPSHVRTHNNNASIQMLHFNSIQFNSACKIDSVSQFNSYGQNHPKYQVPSSQIHAEIKLRVLRIDTSEFAFPWLDIKYRSSSQFATSIYSTICKHFETSSEWKWNHRIKRNIFGLTEYVRMSVKTFRISFWIIFTIEGQLFNYPNVSSNRQSWNAFLICDDALQLQFGTILIM